MAYKATRSLPTRVALWIVVGMLSGLAAGIVHGIFYPSRAATTISLVVVCAIGSILALVRYMMLRRQERPADTVNDSGQVGGGPDGEASGTSDSDDSDFTGR